MSTPRVLLLRPEVAIDDTAAAVLSSEGFCVELAQTGSEALQILDGGHIALCVIDLTAKSVEGYLVYKALRVRPLQERPALLLLVAGQESAEEEIAADGRATALAKPFFADALVVAARDLIGQVGNAGASGDPVADAPKNITGNGSPEGRIIVVCGAKGGTGKTFVSINFAAALAKTTGRAAIVDANLQFGEIAPRLRLPADRSLYNLAAFESGLSWSQVQGTLRGHRSGLHVLAAPPHPWLAEHISTELIAKVLRLLRQHYPYVVVDTPTAYDPKTLTAIEEADDIVLLATQDEAVRRHALSFVGVAKRLGFLNKVRVVLNMYDGKRSPLVDKLEKELRARLMATIGVDSAALAARERAGDPIIKEEGNGSAARDIVLLADSCARLVSQHPQAHVNNRRRFPLLF